MIEKPGEGDHFSVETLGLNTTVKSGGLNYNELSYLDLPRKTWFHTHQETARSSCLVCVVRSVFRIC